MVSTLIETININADDFTDNFLTCPTCMSHYDNLEHTPKLLPCSHTLCRSCLEKITSTSSGSSPSSIRTTSLTLNTNNSTNTLNTGQAQSSSIINAAADAALASLAPSTSGSRSSITQSTLIVDVTFRCPICRETIQVPRGGVASFPPSFIVNQLIDLVGRQCKRDLVPRCTNHPQEELLFCETCDSVFCAICESHCRLAQNSDHIVIPFSIAIKRMSEILCFKSNQCINSFNIALSNVNREMDKLNSTVENVAEQVTRSYNELKLLIDKKRDETLNNLCLIRDKKMNLLKDQMKVISNEKMLVENECKQHENKIEIRYLTQRIQFLNEKLDLLRTLCEPRENSYINYEYNQDNTSEFIKTKLKEYGKFKTSSTYPPLCKAMFESANSICANLKTTICVQTVDYYGKKRSDGGDPLTVFIHDPNGRQLDQTQIELDDENDGTYKIKFTPKQSGYYRIDINVFDRSINESPYQLIVSEHINALWSYGSSKGKQQHEFNMPVSVRYSNEHIYVLDSGNNRIKLINKKGEFRKHIDNCLGLNESSCTALCLGNKNNLISINWRLKLFTIFENILNDVEKYNCKYIDIKKPLEEPIQIMETFDSDLYLVYDSKRLHMCDGNNACVIHENIDEKMRTYCGIKMISSYCCSLDQNKKKRVFVADSQSNIYEFDFEWLIQPSLNTMNSNNRQLSYCSTLNSSLSSSSSVSASASSSATLPINSANFGFRKFINTNIQALSTSTMSLISNNSSNSQTTSISSPINISNSTKGSYTALYYDEHTQKLLAAKCDKQKTVIEIYNSETHLYEYSIDSNEDKLRRVTSMCCTNDGHLICADLVQNCVKLFRYI